MSWLSSPSTLRENDPVKNQTCKVGLLDAYFTQCEALETPCFYADLFQKSKREKEGWKGGKSQPVKAWDLSQTIRHTRNITWSYHSPKEYNFIVIGHDFPAPLWPYVIGDEWPAPLRPYVIGDDSPTPLWPYVIRDEWPAPLWPYVISDDFAAPPWPYIIGDDSPVTLWETW